MKQAADNLVLFDGLCNLCTRSVQFIIRHDQAAIFKFASVQSELGKEFYRKHGLDWDNPQTFLLVDGDRIFQRSDAAIEVARRFGGFWRMVSIFKIVPRRFRDWVYRIIANNRYRWFGKREQCMIPTEQIKNRFLS
ncbi:MAG TPA: thiol-disulfide oxidoreductase DCC family protein [Tepidisphaeraceae bacterium]|nr:thiol-disulfide oxidoreductase DCC family protein [Tepidisphaeraceae bacterium]